jgi:FlaA1/EpsC-like NDP-sugar epimerase
MYKWKDPFTLMRMIDVNIFNTRKHYTIDRKRNKKYFCVSTDKAANPVNMMGASKRIMEMYLMRKKWTNYNFDCSICECIFQTVLYCMVSIKVF